MELDGFGEAESTVLKLPVRILCASASSLLMKTRAKCGVFEERWISNVSSSFRKLSKPRRCEKVLKLRKAGDLYLISSYDQNLRKFPLDSRNRRPKKAVGRLTLRPIMEKTSAAWHGLGHSKENNPSPAI